MKIVRFFVICTVCLYAGSAFASIINVPLEHGTIQEGIDVAQDGDTVQVDVGIYNERFNFNGRAIVVRGNPSIPEDVVIEGAGNGSLVTFNHNEDERSVLTGFTLTDGRCETGGGAILVSGASPTLENLIILENWANVGGGVYVISEGSPTLRDILFMGNQVQLNGGAIAIWRASAILQNVTIYGSWETPAIMGGGIYITGGVADMDRVSLINCDGDLGSACSFWGSRVSMRNALIIANQGENGVAFYLNGGELSLSNATVGMNGADPDNASAIFSSGCNVTMRNSIFLEDMDNRTDLMIFHHGVLDMDYNDIIGGQEDIVNDQADLVWGEHNIDSDPLFININEGDFTISPESPCLDAGSPESPADPDGSPADIGAFYLHQRDIALDPESMEFAPVEPGLSASRLIIVLNLGLTPLVVEPPMIEPEESPFTPRGDIVEPVVIEPDGRLEVWVDYYPEEYIASQAELVIISNDFDRPEIRIPVSAGQFENVDNKPNTVPAYFGLSAYPNPFNPSTEISFDIPEPSDVSMVVFDLSGKEIVKLVSNRFEAGSHTVNLDLTGCKSGAYLVRLETPRFKSAEKLILVR